MSINARKELEKYLPIEFGSVRSSCASLKSSKNKLALRGAGNSLAEIYIQYLAKADGYYAGLEVLKCEAMDFCMRQSPPYTSKLLNSSFLSKTSLSERDKEFGDEIGGIIRAPELLEVKSTARKIQQRLVEFYLPAAENCITGSLSLIDDILISPDNYAFPFLASLFCAQKNELALESDKFQKVLSTKKIFGNKKFDIALAQKILSQV